MVAVTLAGFVPTWTPAIVPLVTESVTTPLIVEGDDASDFVAVGDGLGTGLGECDGDGEELDTGLGECDGDGEELGTGLGECKGDGDGLGTGLGECEGAGEGLGTVSVSRVVARAGIEIATTVARASRLAPARAPSVRRRPEVIDLSAAGTRTPLTCATGAKCPLCIRPLLGCFVWT